ncbi:MAG: creatininase family protein [Bacillota bacterium]|nr:creatininase family protein [Bacillota bacterium]
MNEALKITGHAYTEGKYDKAILSVGSCENHGQHLPLGTDTLVSYELSKKIADKVKGLLVLPPVTVGYSQHYSHFPFTMSLRAETLIEVLKDLLSSVIKNGITKIFIMNGHDGNIAAIETASRAIKMQYPEVKIASLDAWWVAAGNLLPADTFEVWNGLGHAGEGETSMALDLFGDLVEMQYARGVVPTNLPEHIDIKWNFAELTDCGATGDPTKGTLEKGQKMEEVLVKAVVDFLNQMDANGWSYHSDQSALK